MDQIFIDQVQRTACVQTGARFGAINATLDEYGLHTPGGGCEDVCAGGYMQGGGYGFSSRRYGMNIDNVLSFRMMLADGQVVPASRDRNPDLYWAVRGGTGNNFGVLLDTTYRLHSIGPVWGFSLRWDLEDAPEVLEEMQKNYMLTDASRDLGYMALILADTSKKMALWMRGMYFGSAAQGKAALASLLRIHGVTMDIDETGSYYALNRKLLDEGLAFPPPPKHLNEDKQSGYIEASLTRVDWALILDHWKTAPHYLCCAVIEPYGGRIAEIPVHDCAFVHRSVAFNFVVDTFWDDDADRHRSVAWLNDFMARMGRYFNGQIYQNYPRAVMQDYPLAFWGLETYVELCAIKKKYDPDGFFSFPQAIGKWRPPAGAKGIGDPALTAAIQNPVIAVEI
jgi:FAD binding domain/Berberine and berberine like